MNSTITKFVIASQKNHEKFEDRLCAIISAGQSGELALETLILGVPQEVKILNSAALMKQLSQYCSRIKEFEIRNLKLWVSFERNIPRYFRNKEEASKATNYYSGKDNHSEEYPYLRYMVDENNSAELNIATLEEKGIISVARI